MVYLTIIPKVYWPQKPNGKLYFINSCGIKVICMPHLAWYIKNRMILHHWKPGIDMIKVNKEKLRMIIRASRQLPPAETEGLQMDFDSIVSKIRKLILDSYMGKFDIMKNEDTCVNGIAASAFFIKKAYEIIGIQGEGDKKVLKWAERPDFEEDWSGKPSRAYSYIFDRLFSAIMETATDGRETFFAFQQLFDDAMEAGAGHIAKKIIVQMNGMPQADLDIFADDVLKYVKKIGTNAFFDSLPKLFLRKESAFCRVVAKKIETSIGGDEKTMAEAQNWLKQMESSIGTVNIRDERSVVKDSGIKHK